MENLAKSIRVELARKRPDISEVTTITLKRHKIVLTTPESKISIRDAVTFYIASIDIKTCHKYKCFVRTVDDIINLLRLGDPNNLLFHLPIATSLFGVVFAFLAIIHTWISKSPDTDIPHLYFLTILVLILLIILSIANLCDPKHRYSYHMYRLLSRRKYIKKSALPIPIRNEILAYL